MIWFFEASVEVRNWLHALHCAQGCVTRRRYPQARLLHAVMFKILLVGIQTHGLFIELRHAAGVGWNSVMLALRSWHDPPHLPIQQFLMYTLSQTKPPLTHFLMKLQVSFPLITKG